MINLMQIPGDTLSDKLTAIYQRLPTDSIICVAPAPYALQSVRVMGSNTGMATTEIGGAVYMASLDKMTVRQFSLSAHAAFNIARCSPIESTSAAS